jgi:predicted nucleotidyltransferase
MMKNSFHYNDTKLNTALPVLEFKLKQFFKEKLRKIILCGSYARGNYDNESDVDILIVINDNDLGRYNRLLSQIELELLTTMIYYFLLYRGMNNTFRKI